MSNYTRVTKKQLLNILKHVGYVNSATYKAVTISMIPSSWHPDFDYQGRAVEMIYSNAKHFTGKDVLTRFEENLKRFKEGCLHPEVGTKVHFYIKREGK